jgi:hypothetical protein
MRILRYLGYSELMRESEGKSPRAESYLAMSNIRGLLLRHVGRLLDQGTLECRPFEAGGQYPFFDYTITKDMSEAGFKGQDCVLGLVIGASDANTATSLGCNPIQRHLFAGLSFRVKPASPSSSSPRKGWTPVQLRQKGIRSKRALGFAETLFECLPEAEKKRRLQKAAAEEAVTTSRRARLLDNYDSLSATAQKAFDGKVFLWSGQDLQISGKICRRLQGYHVTDDDRLRILQSLGYTDMAAPVPVRFVVKTDGSAGSFKTGRYRKVPLGVTAEAFSFNGVWLPLPFVISGMHGAYENEEPGFGRIAAVFREIGKVTTDLPVDAEDTTPVFFRPFAYKIDRTGKAGGGAFLLAINPTPYATITIPALTMHRVWGGPWGVEPKERRDGWVHIRGTGVRKFEDLNFCLSRDRHEHWVERVPGARWQDEGLDRAGGQVPHLD